MSLKQNNFRRIIVQEGIKNPISFRYKRKNNNSDKNKNPIYNNPFYIKTDLNKIENTNFLISNENNNIGIAHKHNFSYNIDFLNKNDSQKSIYVKKNMHFSPQRCNSDRELNTNFFHPKSSNYHQIFSDSRNNIKNKNYNRIKIFNDKNKNENIININLIKGKSNFIEYEKINHIYINKNKKNISLGGKYSLSNLSLNNKTEENFSNVNLTERNSIQRKNNFFCHYSSNNDYNNNKNQITPRENELNTKKTITKKRVNYLPRVIKSPIKEYNEFYIIKIQSVIRGYLLNKRLDRILRHYINFKDANEIMKRFYKRKIFKIIKAFKKVKRYQHQNIYYCKKRNYSQNKLTNIKNKENKNIQFKINELINEKNEQQINFKDLKDFMNNYKQLINEKVEMLQEINKLRKTINKLQNIQEQKIINKNEKLYLIQKQKSLKFVNTKNININNNENNKTKESKKIQNVKDFLTLAKESQDNNDLIQNDKNKLRISILKYLFKNKIKQRFI